MITDFKKAMSKKHVETRSTFLVILITNSHDEFIEGRSVRGFAFPPVITSAHGSMSNVCKSKKRVEITDDQRELIEPRIRGRRMRE